MRDYGVSYKSVTLMCDSSSAICLAQNLVFDGRVKHIKVRHHFLRDHVEKCCGFTIGFKSRGAHGCEEQCYARDTRV
jgi:hypothetical protein